MTPQNRTGFVAALFAFALCALAAGGIALYKNFDVWQNGRQATMHLAYPDKKIVEYNDVLSTTVLAVKYVSDADEVIVPNKTLPKSIADRLIAGDTIPVTYLTNNLQRVLYQGYQLPNPWIWLIVGAITLAVAMYALRLLKREMND